MALDDLSWMQDEELAALEQQRSLAPADWSRIDAEWRRRRQGRRVALADVTDRAMAGAADSVSLGDLERVAMQLEARLDGVERRLRGVRRWVVLAPLGWAIVAAGTWLALRAWAPALLAQLASLP